MALLTDGNPNDSEAWGIRGGDLGRGERRDHRPEHEAVFGHGGNFSGRAGYAARSHATLSLTSPVWVEDRRQIGVSDVVVSPQMKRWHALHTLAVVYRDAYNNQLNDRYEQVGRISRTGARGEGAETAQYGIGRFAGAGHERENLVLGARQERWRGRSTTRK